MTVVTGGRRGIVEAYAPGRCVVAVRGTVNNEQRHRRDVIVIDQIPSQVVQRRLIEKIVECTRKDAGQREARIGDISDVSNHSGRDAQTRIVITLKKGADPQVV